jgi:hypothetical protein
MVLMVLRNPILSSYRFADVAAPRELFIFYSLMVAIKFKFSAVVLSMFIQVFPILELGSQERL